MECSQGYNIAHIFLFLTLFDQIKRRESREENDLKLKLEKYSVQDMYKSIAKFKFRGYFWIVEFESYGYF